jgi:hypothetical protein
MQAVKLIVAGEYLELKVFLRYGLDVLVLDSTEASFGNTWTSKVVL